jgi:hypothetical protein
VIVIVGFTIKLENPAFIHPVPNRRVVFFPEMALPQCLDFLGFIRAIRDFSMGYDDKKQENRLSILFAPGASRAAPGRSGEWAKVARILIFAKKLLAHFVHILAQRFRPDASSSSAAPRYILDLTGIEGDPGPKQSEASNVVNGWGVLTNRDRDRRWAITVRFEIEKRRTERLAMGVERERALNAAAKRAFEHEIERADDGQASTPATVAISRTSVSPIICVLQSRARGRP